MTLETPPPIPLVIATRNKGKIQEIKTLLKDFPVVIRDLDDFGPIPPVIEDGRTFDDNAYKKASFTARVLGFPTLADDSGLCVDALGGAPGVYSARYGGEGLSDQDRCRKLIDEMAGQADRTAAFHCVVSIAVPQGPALTYEAQCQGIITESLSGKNGFGYDPVFYYPPLNKTFAQLTMDEKNSVSHRGKVLKEIQDEFDKILVWIQRHMPITERFDCAGD